MTTNFKITDEEKRCVSGQIAMGHSLYKISKSTGYSNKKVIHIAGLLGLELPKPLSKDKVMSAWKGNPIPGIR